MTENTLEVLNGTGHITVTWNPNVPEEVAKAQEEVSKLRALGYSFFVVVPGEDAVLLGDGQLLVERVDDPTAVKATTDTETAKSKGKAGKGKRHVAVKPLGGG